MGSLQFPNLDAAIAKFEGFGDPNSLAARNNNPGNLIPGAFSTSHGATGSNSGFAVFPDLATGLSAEDSLVASYANKGATISDLINAWAPPTAPGNSPQATQNYIDSVAQSLGVSSDTPVSTLKGAPGDSTSTASTLAQTLQSILGLGYGNAFPLMNQTGALSYSRIGAFLVGMILIAGGIYLFKPVQEVVQTTVRTARTAAEGAGAAAAV